MWTIAISNWEKLAVNATWEFVPRFAVLRCPLVTIHMVVVKGVPRLVCRVLKAPGVRKPWVPKPGAINEPGNTLFEIGV
jgi:hypothetical protein